MSLGLEFVDNYLDQLSGEVTLVSQGDIVKTYKIKDEGEELFLQYKPGDGGRIRAGHAALKVFEETSIPTPEIHSYSPKPTVLVTESLGNETLSNRNDDSLYRQAGRILGQIHQEHSYSRYGLLSGHDGTLFMKGDDNWREEFTSLYDTMIDDAEEFLDDVDSVTEYITMNIMHVPLNAESSILHGDFDPRNIVVKEDEVSGVIDWDMVRVGDSNLELVEVLERLERRDKPVKPFEKGYKQVRSVDIYEGLENIYALQSNIKHLSGLSLHKQNNIDISDRNKDSALNRIEQIVGTN